MPYNKTRMLNDPEYTQHVLEIKRENAKRASINRRKRYAEDSIFRDKCKQEQLKYRGRYKYKRPTSKTKNSVEKTCQQCGKLCYTWPSAIKKKKTDNYFCSNACSNTWTSDHTKKVLLSLVCSFCEKPFLSHPHEMLNSKSGNYFCSNVCNAKYQLLHAKKTNRSYGEQLLFSGLVAKFPSLTILPNNKDLLPGFEVDIAIPSLKLGIEWNGILHYQPIYGETTLTKIVSRDEGRFQLSQRLGVRLIIIPDLTKHRGQTKKLVDEQLALVSAIVLDLLT